MTFRMQTYILATSREHRPGIPWRTVGTDEWLAISSCLTNKRALSW
jgi:hypothetical protein